MAAKNALQVRTDPRPHLHLIERPGTVKPSLPEDKQELAHLRKLLTSQESAKQAAQAKVSEVTRQLKTTEAEKNQVHMALRRSQTELATTKQEHAVDLQRAAEREEGLKSELVEVRGKAVVEGTKAAEYWKRLFATSLILAVPAMLWVASVYGHSEVSPPHIAAPAIESTPKPVPSDFSAGVGQLSRALDHFKNERAEDVLRRVHKANAAQGKSVCSFEWNKGEVSMVFGSSPEMAIGTSMSQCADAVEKAAR